ARQRDPHRGDALVPRRGHAAADAVVGPDAVEHRPRVHGAGAVAGDLPGARHQPRRARLQPVWRHAARRLGSEAAPELANLAERLVAEWPALDGRGLKGQLRRTAQAACSATRYDAALTRTLSNGFGTTIEKKRSAAYP